MGVLDSTPFFCIFHLLQKVENAKRWCAPLVLPSWQPPRVRPRIQNQLGQSPPLLSLSLLSSCLHTPTAASLKIQYYLAQIKYKQPHESSNAVVDGPFPHQSTRNHERKRDEEHKLFLLGLRKAGKGDWRGIARDFVKTRTPTQVAAHAYKFFQRSKALQLSSREKRSYRKSALPVAQENQPSDYTGTKEIEATGAQICAEELVSSPRKTKNLEVVENVSLEVKSDYTGPQEVEATGFQTCAKELVSSPRKSKRNVSLEVESAYTRPEEVKATRFQVCAEELVASPRKCNVLEAVENISLEIIGCCCVFCEEVMGIY